MNIPKQHFDKWYYGNCTQATKALFTHEITSYFEQFRVWLTTQHHYSLAGLTKKDFKKWMMKEGHLIVKLSRKKRTKL